MLYFMLYFCGVERESMLYFRAVEREVERQVERGCERGCERDALLYDALLCMLYFCKVERGAIRKQSILSMLYLMFYSGGPEVEHPGHSPLDTLLSDNLT